MNMTMYYNFSLVGLLTICFIIPFNECLEANPVCHLPLQLGPCNGTLTRYAFMPQKNICEKFNYSGCGENANNFFTAEECLNTCGADAHFEDSKCDRSKCNLRRFAHYLVKKCTPSYPVGSCCPSRFRCDKKLPKSNVKCFYKDKVYDAGDKVQVDDICVGECNCIIGYDNQPAFINCEHIGNPKYPLTPDCRLIYSEDSCFPVEDCSDPDPNLPNCKWNGSTYLLGDIMYFDEFPCQECICTTDFDGPKGPGCSKTDCHWDLWYRGFIAEGCSPIHLEDSCCPINWLCSGARFHFPPSSGALSPEVNSSSAVCAIANRAVPVGSYIQHEYHPIRCTCIIPPDLTCDQYQSSGVSTLQPVNPRRIRFTKEFPVISNAASTRNFLSLYVLKFTVLFITVLIIM